MLAKIWENKVNRIDNVIGSFNFLSFVFLVYAKVPIVRIYGSEKRTCKGGKKIETNVGIKRSSEALENFSSFDFEATH
jgi:hypothetical protein